MIDGGGCCPFVATRNVDICVCEVLSNPDGPRNGDCGPVETRRASALPPISLNVWLAWISGTAGIVRKVSVEGYRST